MPIQVWLYGPCLSDGAHIRDLCLCGQYFQCMLVSGRQKKLIIFRLSFKSVILLGLHRSWEFWALEFPDV